MMFGISVVQRFLKLTVIIMLNVSILSKSAILSDDTPILFESAFLIVMLQLQYDLFVFPLRDNQFHVY